jgi:hypothetical protein
LNDAAREILLRHPRARHVVVLAHSMGGVPAQLAYLMPNHQLGSMDTLVTLNTPHQAHPYTADTSIARMYATMHAAWAALVAGERDTDYEPLWRPAGRLTKPSHARGGVGRYADPHLTHSAGSSALEWASGGMGLPEQDLDEAEAHLKVSTSAGDGQRRMLSALAANFSSVIGSWAEMISHPRMLLPPAWKRVDATAQALSNVIVIAITGGPTVRAGRWMTRMKAKFCV